MSDIKWHSLSVNGVVDKLRTNLHDGLSLDEVSKRQDKYPANKITGYKNDSLLKRFFRQFHNALIYMLIVSLLITLYLSRWIDASVIFGVIVINAIFGFLQEGKAEKALSAIRKMLSPTAEVIRGGEKIIIKASELLPGDLVLIDRGNKVPADIRLCETKSLEVEEAMLTGESLPVEKNSLEVEEGSFLGDRSSMLYSGTLITNGRGMGVVVATGLDTEVGKISKDLSQVESIDTPLLRQINRFGHWLTLLIILIALFVFLVGTFVWHDLGSGLLMGIVGLVVAAVPEGLPPIMTIILAIGMTKMAKHHAIIRRIPAVEAMGSVTVICTDKTGTLTRNELSVQSVVAYKNSCHINDYSVSDCDLEKAIQGVVLCNDAELDHGNPTDMAFLKLGLKFKLDPKLLRQKIHRDDLIPYETEHKFMATLNHDHDGDGFIYIKGAPEIILAKCSKQQVDGEINSLDKNYWRENIERLASNGERVIAVAYKKVPTSKTTLHFSDVESELILVALFGLIDPPRKEAIVSVKECQDAGINVKMITGDHFLTASAIADRVGIESEKVLTGKMIDEMSDEDLTEVVKRINVYARTTPQHKLRLVKALQSENEIVAMTGDGINDAPALKQADIGVAMGEKGADLARESSEMVLTDDNFATIVTAIREGRTIYDNLKKAILFILPVSFAQAMAIMVAILFGLVIPITAVQILWVNMITAVTLCLAFGFEPPDALVMKRPPRRSSDSILTWHLMWRVISVSLIFAAIIFGAFIFVYHSGVSLEIARTVAVNVLVLGEVFYLINCRNLKSSSINLKSFFGSKPILISVSAIMILQLIFTYLPFMQQFFGTVSIGLNYWAMISVFALVAFILVEFEKLLLRKWS